MKMVPLFLVLLSFHFTLCDVPTNCSFADTVGKWSLHLGASNQTLKIDCSKNPSVVSTIQIELLFPNIVVDQYGNEGTWTMIYNQGFEVLLSGRRYFAFQYYENRGRVPVSFCNTTFSGWVHDDVNDNVFPPKNWGCYFGIKLFPNAPAKVSHEGNLLDKMTLCQPYGLHEELVEQINNHQTSWKAGVYEHYENITYADIIRKSGGRKTLPKVRSIPITPEIQVMADDMPDEFDWRSKEMVSPVRNQGACGSCYAFASMGLLEAGVRIHTNGRLKPVYSVQDVVSCSNYSQGCEGGFPYLIAGKYAQDFGVAMESDYPYIGNDTATCNPLSIGTRIHVNNYGYVGGFYGGCNEAVMRVALVKTGPIVVGINVTSDFLQYKGGIFHHTGLGHSLGYNPFEITNHAVLAVGYGIDHDSGEKFWIVKNSWGTGWGEDGYFRIRRATDEISIESLAVYAVPYVGQ